MESLKKAYKTSYCVIIKKNPLFSIYTYVDHATPTIVPNFAVCPEHLITIIHCSMQEAVLFRIDLLHRWTAAVGKCIFFLCCSIWQGRHWLPHFYSHTCTHSLWVQRWVFGWIEVQVRIEWLTFDSPTDRRSLDSDSHLAWAATAMWCVSVLGADSEWMEKHKMSVFDWRYLCSRPSPADGQHCATEP